MKRLFRSKTATVVSAFTVLATASAAVAYWTTLGSGSATAATPTVLPITVTSDTPTNQLYPGGSANLAAVLSNPNAFTVHVGALSLDTSQGTSGYAVDGGHAGCSVNSLNFTPQTNGGDGWTVPPKAGGVDGTLAVDLSSAVSMSTGADNACQGATVTVYLTASGSAVAAIANTAGLISLWRMGNDPLAADNFTGTAATTLQNHSGTYSVGWTKWAATNDAELSSANRARRSTTGSSWYYAATTPASADYAVTGDVYVGSLAANEYLDLYGRWDTTDTNGTYYYAEYDVTGGVWRLGKSVAGVATSLGTSAQALTVGQTYKLRLDMVGTTISLLVNNVSLVSVTDASISAAGKPGIKLRGTVAAGNAVGLHLDNFRMYTNTGTAVTDTMGRNTATFANSPRQNIAGAIAGDPNGAALFNGANQYAQVVSPASLPTGASARTYEGWFRTASNSSQAIASYGTLANAKMFSLMVSDNQTLKAWNYGGGNDHDFMTPYHIDDDAWHYVALTYNGTQEEMYLDGTSIGTHAVTLNTLVDATGLGIGSNTVLGDGNSGKYFNGSLDEVAVYNVALSAATISAHYHMGIGS